MEAPLLADSVQYFIREQGKGTAGGEDANRLNRVPSVAAPSGRSRAHRPACPAPVTIYNASTGERLILPCKRRLCVACGPTRWRPKVLAKLHSGLQDDPQRYLVLLLTAPGNANRHYFNANASHYWHRFWTSANRWWPGLAYWKVAELQQRGHVHFHVILRGRSHIDIEQLRRLAIRSGFGAWVGIRRPIDYKAQTKGAAGYLGKYLLKDYLRFAGEPNLVSMSRTWPTLWRSPVKTPSTDRWITEYELRRLRESAQPAPSARKGPAAPDGRGTRLRRRNPSPRSESFADFW